MTNKERTPEDEHEHEWGPYEKPETGEIIVGTAPRIGAIDTLGHIPEEEVRSNARPIAAAPDLLEAARDVLSAWGWACGDNTRNLHELSQGGAMRIGDALDRLDAAITKAEGRDQG